MLSITVEWKSFPVRTEMCSGGGDGPALVSHAHRPVCDRGHHWERLLGRSAPQSGWGISRYHYDNNTAIHLVNLETSSPPSWSSAERAPPTHPHPHPHPHTGQAGDLRSLTHTHTHTHTSISTHFLKRVIGIIHTQLHTGFALSGVGRGWKGDPAGCRGNSWVPYSVNTKGAPLPAQSLPCALLAAHE